MKRIAPALLVCVALAVVVAAGCGGGSGSPQGMSEPARVLDHALREAVAGNFDPLIQLIPPESRAYYQGAITTEFAYRNGEVLELSFRTEEADADHVVVYFWGSISYESAQIFFMPRL